MPGGYGHGVRLGYSRAPGWDWLTKPGSGATVPRLLSGPWPDNYGRPEGNWVSVTGLGRLGVCAFCVPFPWDSGRSSRTNPCSRPPLVSAQAPPCSLRLPSPLTLTARGPFSHSWPCSYLLNTPWLPGALDTAHLWPPKALCDLGPPYVSPSSCPCLRPSSPPLEALLESSHLYLLSFPSAALSTCTTGFVHCPSPPGGVSSSGDSPLIPVRSQGWAQGRGSMAITGF